MNPARAAPQPNGSPGEKNISRQDAKYAKAHLRHAEKEFDRVEEEIRSALERWLEWETSRIERGLS